MTQRFGAKKHTGKKLDVLDHWHGFFPFALKNSRLRLIYIDAFAGSGDVLVAEDDDANQLLPGIEPQRLVLEGSATRALKAAIPYDDYIFIEKNATNLRRLRSKLSAKFPALIGRCQFMQSDANAALRKICAETDWKKARAVIFLDPFGNQIEWETLELIAATEAADVWYLFPAGLGVWRQIPKEGEVQDAAASSVTKMLGDSTWKYLFTRRASAQDLFGEEQVSVSRDATVPAVIDHAISRLRTIFRGVVLDEYVKLGGTDKMTWYALLFASANPSPKAKDLAQRVARYIVTHAG